MVLQDLINEIKDVVSEHPGLTGREIAYHIRKKGYHNVTRRDVNQVLYFKNSPFNRIVDQNAIPAWYLKDEVVNSPILDSEDEDVLIWSDSLELYPWQIKALREWESNGCQGVIEAVTGTGKTRVALAAIEAHLRKNWRILVLVPTVALQTQWKKVLKNHLIDCLNCDVDIGLLGGGKNDSLNTSQILIAVAPSASKYRINNDNYKGLLIADECHRYGSDTWALALKEAFERRLGLTATYERPDQGIEKYLDPYFKRVCYTLNYEEALKDGVIANFKIAFIGINLSESEKNIYMELNNRCSKLRGVLIDRHGVVKEPFGEFMKEVNVIASGGEGVVTGLARKYLNSFSKRRQLLASSLNKVKSLVCLVPAINFAERTILFAQTKAAADLAVLELMKSNVRGALLDSTMSLDERKDVFAGFEDGKHELVAAPILLDEGIDVPSADLAIVLAASRSRRQMIQRMGRVLRKKNDARLARIAILYLKGTSEDPEMDVHETYIDLIMGAANDIKVFSFNTDNSKISEFLNEIDTFDSLWEFCTSNNRLCPKYDIIRDVHELLKDTEALSGHGDIREPADPYFIYQNWANDLIMPIELQLLFKSYLEWAEDHNQIKEVGIYLRSLKEEDWMHFGGTFI